MFEIDNLGDDFCFLCGTRLDNSRSDEHVFPKWLLRQTNLWNETCSLPNGSLLAYRQCVIPCCVACNSGPLSALENDVQHAFDSGVGGVASLDPARLSLWTAKIYYGILRRCCSLRADRKDPSSSPIVTVEAMKTLSTLHVFLQRIRFDHRSAFDPDSTFICNLHSYSEPARNFDWLATTLVGKPGKARFVPAIAIRHNGVGVISIFGDGGAQRTLRRSIFDEFADVSLHPVQFVELACRSFYGHSLFTDRVGYLFLRIGNGPLKAVPHIQDDSPIWNEWDNEEFEMYFFRCLKDKPYSGVCDLSDVYVGSERFISFLHWPDGTKRVATADELR